MVPWIISLNGSKTIKRNTHFENWPYDEARQLFMNPEVTNASEINLKWKEPDVDGLIEFMVKQKGFSEDRIRSGAEKLKKGLKGGVQGRLDGFFKVVKTDDKRKADPKESKASKRRKIVVQTH